MVASSLAILVSHIVELVGVVGEPIIITLSCFIIGASATFLRFFPEIKRKYDYELLIFMLNFNMITVSGYRVDNIFVICRQRLYTMAIGFSTALLINLCISPAWAGEDLHHSIVKRFHSLADSLEGDNINALICFHMGYLSIFKHFKEVINCCRMHDGVHKRIREL